MRPTGSPATSVRNYHYSQRRSPEEHGSLPANNCNVSRNLLSGHALAFFLFQKSLLLYKTVANRFIQGGSQINAAFQLHRLPVPQSVFLFTLISADKTTNIRTIAMLQTVIS